MVTRPSVGVMAVCGLLLASGIAACGGSDGPTVGQAGAKLVKDANTLIDQEPHMAKVSVKESAEKNISCGHGAFKREFKATAEFQSDVPKSRRISGAIELTKNSLFDLGYTPKIGNDATKHQWTLYGSSKKTGAVFVIYVRDEQPVYTITAHTRCLPAG